MRCSFCHNPDTWDFKAPVQYEWTPEELLSETLLYRNYIKTGGVTATGGEPLMQAEFLTEYFRLCHREGIHTCLDTSGVKAPTEGDAVSALLDVTDLVMLDVKTTDDELHKRLTAHTRDNNRRFLDYLQQKGLRTWIRHVVTPGINDDTAHLRSVIEYIKRYPIVERVEILPYHSMGKAKYEKLGIDYPLRDTPDMSRERSREIVEMFRHELNCEII